jgi:hypothetical protein
MNHFCLGIAILETVGHESLGRSNGCGFTVRDSWGAFAANREASQMVPNIAIGEPTESPPPTIRATLHPVPANERLAHRGTRRLTQTFSGKSTTVI